MPCSYNGLHFCLRHCSLCFLEQLAKLVDVLVALHVRDVGPTPTEAEPVTDRIGGAVDLLSVGYNILSVVRPHHSQDDSSTAVLLGNAVYAERRFLGCSLVFPRKRQRRVAVHLPALR